MKSFILSLCAVIFSFGIAIPEAEAKRLGSGGSIGMQRQATPSTPPRQAAAAPAAGAQTAAAQPRRSWMGPIAGLAAGLGLAALFSHLGLGEEMASFLMIALLVVAAVFLFRMLTRNRAAQGNSAMQYAGAGAGGVTPPAASPAYVAGGSAAATANPAIPADFDAAGFVRQAKVQFIRLQAANDAGNLDDIREFTSPEMFAEIRMQIGDRGATAQRTDVVELNGEVVEVVEEANRYIVSVRFNGLLREEDDAAPTAFDEIWHLTKSRSGSTGWVLAGIQQLA